VSGSRQRKGLVHLLVVVVVEGEGRRRRRRKKGRGKHHNNRWWGIRGIGRKGMGREVEEGFLIHWLPLR
jgi:hypothetical protein